jgi:predicted DNA-binding antitoxin AbrB/MazE fold protein
MSITVEAIYENGVLRVARPLPLPERAKVRVTIQSEPSLAQRTAGLFGWKGDAATVDFFALAPELDPQEGP